MKAVPALLCLLFSIGVTSGASEPEPPQTLPLIYDEFGNVFILRIDQRRYQMPIDTKAEVVRSMTLAKYAKTKLLFDEFKRALEAKAKADETIKRAQSNADRESRKVSQIRQTLDSLRAQLAFLRSQPSIDVREVIFLQEQIRSYLAQLESAESQEAKAKGSLDRTQGAAEKTIERAEQAKQEYVAALTEYERRLSEIRSVALTLGSPL